MFKSLSALFRGRAHEVAEDFIDRNAIAVLRQQIRDCAARIDVSRRSVAVATAQQEREEANARSLADRKADLETRAVAAMEAGADATALEAAEAIAELEAELASSAKAVERYRTKLHHLRAEVRTAQSRLRELQRGERLAMATKSTEQLQATLANGPESTLADAEATLKRLEDRQDLAQRSAVVEREIAGEGKPEDLAQRMARDGFGTPLTTTAQQVLERLRAGQKPAKSAKSKAETAG